MFYTPIQVTSGSSFHVNSPAPALSFDQIKTINRDELLSLGLNSRHVSPLQSIGISQLPEYRDSFFIFKVIETFPSDTWQIVRKQLHQRSELEKTASIDYSALLEVYKQNPGNCIPNLAPSTAYFLSPKQLTNLAIPVRSSRPIHPDQPKDFIGTSELDCFSDSFFEVYHLSIFFCLVVRRSKPCKDHSCTGDIRSIGNRVLGLLDPSSGDKKEFCTRDIRLIGNRTLGLRHLSSAERASQEALHGMYDGCSLNISFGKAEPGNQNLYEGLHNKTEQEINDLLTDYESGIKEFIKNSLNEDTNYSLNTNDLTETAQKTHFLVVEYEPNTPISDSHSWGRGHGRFSKRNVNAEKISVLKLPRQVNVGESANYQTLLDHLVTLHITSLINYIRA